MADLRTLLHSLSSLRGIRDGIHDPEPAELRMDEAAAPRMSGLLPRTESPIVPKHSIAGRALVAVVAIMTFLASLTIGAVMLVRSAAVAWQSDVAREITIQVRPVQGREIEVEVRRAVEIARNWPGLAAVRPYSKDESARLLEPWLGSGLSLDELPVPRIIVARLASGASVDLPALRRTLTEQVPGASLDDHRAWTDRMRTMANASVFAGIGILILMIVTTVLSVTFATRGAMAANRPIVEVLHFIGASGAYIASQFQRHFLMLGLKGGLLGGGLAMLVFALGGIVAGLGYGTTGGDQLAVLFGRFSLGFYGYLAIVGQIVLIAAVTALTSRHTVDRTLATME
jgi:cell division transport system permease protein